MPGVLRKNLKFALDLVTLARLPFHIIGVLPFLFGASLAFKARSFDAVIFGFSLAAVMLTIAATHYNGERYDMAEDSLCRERTPFSSGTGLAVSGTVAPETIVRAAGFTALCALAVGFLLQFVFRTGPYTLALGLCGLLSGYYYSKPPLRLVARGAGEPLIGFCYGLLVPSSGFYPQTGYIHQWIMYAALPIACATSSVIWANEIIDFPFDAAAGKRNLVVRMGLGRAKTSFLILSLVQVISCWVSVRLMGQQDRLFFFVPAFVFSVASAAAVGSASARTGLLAGCGLAIAACVCLSLGYITLVLFHVP